MRWPRQVVWLLFVLLLLVVPPAVLVVVVGPPVRGWPDGQQVRAWVQQPLTEQTLTAALTVAAWLLWLVVAYTVTVRVLARLRAGAAWLRRMPLPTPLQATAGGMAGAAVFTISAGTAAGPPPEPAHPVTAGALDTPPEPADGDSEVVWRDGGVVVPGGWLPREVAEQVAAAAALVWLRRRSAYRPRRPGAAAREDADLAPLPAAAAVVQAALAEHPAPSQPAGDGSYVESPVLVCDLPAGGVGLTGAGAAAAARGLLVTALLARPVVSLLLTRSVLVSLLGAAAEDLGHRLPRLQVVADVDEAAQVLAAGHDGHGPDQPARRDDPARTGTPLMVIVDEPPSPAAAQRLAGLSPAAAVVVLGAWPAAATWQVDLAGHARDPHQPERSGPRLCVLDTQAATDLLTVIAHASPPADPPAPAPSSHAPRRFEWRVPRQSTGPDPRPRPAVPSRQLQLQVLGEPALTVDGEPVAIRRSAALQALVFLAAHPDGADSQQLVEAIWPGLPRHSLTGRLYTTLSELRGAIRSASGLTVVEHTDDRYRLNPTHLDVDLWRFHAVLQHAATAVTQATTAWQAVIDAYPGDLAAGRAWPWLDPIREATRRQVIDAYVALADATPDPHNALAVLQHAIRVDPYNAHLHTRAMNILAALGDHDAAADLHRTYTRRLTDAGLDSSDEIRDTAVWLSSAPCSTGSTNPPRPPAV